MRTNPSEGLFVTFDGPHGAGKSSLVPIVARTLVAKGFALLTTCEPTASPLGRFVRVGEETYAGESLACLVAADRYAHLDREIVPALAAGKTVLCDRYVESSLVLQRLDGLDVDYIWALNSRVRVPDLSVIVTAPPAILAQRLAQRRRLTRFERVESQLEEVQLYLAAAEFLSEKGFEVVIVDNGAASLEDTARQIVETVLSRIGNA